MTKILKRRALFDIIPAGSPEELDLKNSPPTPDFHEVEPREDYKVKPSEKEDLFSEQAGNGLDSLMSEIIEGGEVTPKEEIEALMSSVNDPVVELASVGAVIGRVGRWQGDLRTKVGELESQFHDSVMGSKVIRHQELYETVLSKIREPLSSRTVASLASSNVVRPELAKPKIEARPRLQSSVSEFKKQDFINTTEPKAKGIIAEEVVSFYQNKSAPKTIINLPAKRSINFIDPPKKRRTGWWLTLLIVIGMTVYGFTLKNELIQGGISGLNNLEEAGESLKSFDFTKASDNFGKSYEEFARASQTMSFMGAGIAGIFSDLPGAGKLKSAKDMAEAGKLIAQSGKEMSQAMAALSQTGSILNPADKNKIKPLKILNGLRDALTLSNNNFQKAKALIANVDESIIPDDKLGNFHDFKDKLPLLEEYLGNAVEYTEFLQAIVGIDEPKKYLLLFNNNSELRPTGGFPGTYGVVSFSSGGLSDFFVDDVYNLDGQLKKNIIPPKQLQHITPNWGMRDSSWFFDFPSSAKKAMSFFATEAGYRVNGVIALNPDIVSGILSVVGPIQMPDYGMTLTADNFLGSIQEEVEYGDNRTQPKTVVVDFAPRFLEKLYSADSEKWMKIFNVLMVGLEEKDILFYFEDKNSQNFSVKEGFGGEVKGLPGSDYLAVSFSNIKGSKTDTVTDSSISMDTRLEIGQVVHHVVLSRNHKGGDKEHGFYNRQNPAYVRVLVPEGAKLINISGQDIPNYRPIMNYNLDGSFEKDRDLAVFEAGFSPDNFPGVDRFEESGKDGIGFWMVTNPGTTKKIEFEYSVPMINNQDTITDDYNFYFQKQPGLDWKNFKLKINNPKDYVISGISPGLNRIGDVYLFDELLKKDFELKIKLKNK